MRRVQVINHEGATGMDTQGEDQGWGLALSFAGLFPPAADGAAPPEEVSFIRGFEAGQIWQRMCDGREAEIRQICHSENRVVIERAAAAKGWTVEIGKTAYPEWVDVTLVKAGPSRHNPHGLRVVKP